MIESPTMTRHGDRYVMFFSANHFGWEEHQRVSPYAMGYAGDYPLTVRPDGFSWSHPAGPGATTRYTATIRDYQRCITQAYGR